jgi:hypothetical protein
MTDSTRTIATGAIADAVCSADGTTIYAAQGGTITAYSVATGTVTASWTIGTGGIDLSLDGHSLFAGETTGGPIDQNGNPGASGLWTQTNSFYELDLTTGIATTHRGGVTFGQLADTLLTDGNSAPTTRHVAGTSRTDTFHFDTLLKNLTVTGFDPAHDVIDLHGQGFGTFDPLDAAHAKQIQGLDGTIDTLLTNRCRSRHPARERRPRVALASLSSADFML